MVCGGLGLVIAAALFFGWRRSEAKWKRIIAWIAGVWGGISIAFYLGLGGLYLLDEYVASDPDKAVATPVQDQTRPHETPTLTSSKRGTLTHTPKLTLTPAPTSTDPPTPTAAPQPGDILYQDAFSGSESEGAWLLGHGDGFGADIEDGTLELTAGAADGLAWAQSTRTYRDLDLRIEATILQGGKEASYGILFGRVAPDERYVACLVGGDNAGLCSEVVENETQSGDLVQVQVSPEDQPNQVRFVTVGDQWALYVNGRCVGSGQSQAVGRGQVGLVAATDSDGLHCKIGYDDVVIRVPDSVSRALLGCEPQPYTSEPRSDGSESVPEATRPPHRNQNGTIYLSSETTAEATCRLSVWGGPGEDFLLDAGPGHPASHVPPAGEYAWQMHFGPRGRTKATTMQLPPGGSCSFTCFDDHVGWGCSP
jgi:hypothetical protein